MVRLERKHKVYTRHGELQGEFTRRQDPKFRPCQATQKGAEAGFAHMAFLATFLEASSMVLCMLKRMTLVDPTSSTNTVAARQHTVMIVLSV